MSDSAPRTDKATNSEKYQIIRDAIFERQSLRCTYDGLDRIFSPHMLGYRGNSMVALVYQFEGESWSSETIHEPAAKNWRNFHLTNIQNIEPLRNDPEVDERDKGDVSKKWFTHKSYNGTSSGWTSVAIRVEPEEKDDE